jgi:hypothetical protein
MQPDAGEGERSDAATANRPEQVVGKASPTLEWLCSEHTCAANGRVHPVEGSGDRLSSQGTIWCASATVGQEWIEDCYRIWLGACKRRIASGALGLLVGDTKVFGPQAVSRPLSGEL